MVKKTFQELLSCYLDNQLSPDELAYFLDLMKLPQHQPIVEAAIERLLKDPSYSILSESGRKDIVFEKIMATARELENEQSAKVIPLKPRKFFTLSKVAAAIGFLVISTYIAYVLQPKKSIPITTLAANKTTIKEDVLPGGNKAILTLADGSTIILDSAKNGELAQQGNTKVLKLDGKLAYNAAGAVAKEISYNTITTPVGGQYMIQLADGTEVWLNAASSLRFPTGFLGTERRVEVTGEAYFEVAKNKTMPFVVMVNGAEVKVLGTHFNIMAYKDEPVFKTTLLEGAVQLRLGNTVKILQPGQQALRNAAGEVKVIDGVNVENVVAWKNGLFHFEGEGIESVTRHLARWYDVEVVYTKQIMYDPLHAEFPRHTNLSDALKVLELAGSARFEIQGRKILVK